MKKQRVVHPYIPNSEPSILRSMLDELGFESVEDIFKEIPDRLRYKDQMDLPEAITSEYKLKKHARRIMAQNKNCVDNLSFLGGGTWQHDVPSVCKTIMGRDEFLTAYVGEAYSDHGKFQALFESSSMLADLAGLDACNTPTYDWHNALAIACRMACRTSGKSEILYAANSGPERIAVMKNYVKPELTVREVAYDSTGQLDLEDLKAKLNKSTAVLYFENPSYLGTIELNAEEICGAAEAAGALVIVGVDPTSLGILEGPGHYGADYVVGELQPLGINMSYGGGLGGFILTHDDKEFLGEYPSLLFGISETSQEGEIGFGEVFYERTSYASREKGKDFIGTCAALHGIVAGVYMALMGPQGFKELGEGIMQRVAYAKSTLQKIKGVRVQFNGPSYCDFVLNFDGTGKRVKDINKSLIDRRIFGGKDLSKDFPELGQSALYSITEVHDKADIDRLVTCLEEICA